MIFDTNFTNESSSSLYSMDGIEESKYELGVEGALMHVYENECNYNSLMRAVGLSELKYYTETGKSLFVHEAGAFKGFIEKAKAFFLKVIEKIKSIFKAFVAKINSFVMKDKDFVNKYKSEIAKKDVTDLKFKGYANFVKGFYGYQSYNIDFNVLPASLTGDAKEYSAEEIDNFIEKKRAKVAGESDGSKLTEKEFIDKLKEKLYGDKEEVDVTKEMVSKALDTISNTKTIIKSAEEAKNAAIKTIDKAVKDLNEAEKKYKDNFKPSGDDEANKKLGTMTSNTANYVRANKALSNDMTIAYSTYVRAAKDANRQARALCVKVIGYNKKAEESAEINTNESTNIFDTVDFA